MAYITIRIIFAILRYYTDLITDSLGLKGNLFHRSQVLETEKWIEWFYSSFYLFKVIFWLLLKHTLGFFMYLSENNNAVYCQIIEVLYYCIKNMRRPVPLRNFALAKKQMFNPFINRHFPKPNTYFFKQTRSITIILFSNVM